MMQLLGDSAIWLLYGFIDGKQWLTVVDAKLVLNNQLGVDTGFAMVSNQRGDDDYCNSPLVIYTAI